MNFTIGYEKPSWQPWWLKDIDVASRTWSLLQMEWELQCPSKEADIKKREDVYCAMEQVWAESKGWA